MKRLAFAVVLAVLCLRVPFADAGQLRTPDSGLTVVSTAPEGEMASLAEAKEIRVVFSEPMVNLGRIPAEFTPAFFRIAPAVPGTFRWSGTTVLIFTPDPKRPLSSATTYQVTIAAGTPAASGRKLASAVTFSFTTPTVRLLQTRWYRRDGTVNSRMVFLLRFNQPVRPADVARSLTASLEPHAFEAPQIPADGQAGVRAIDPDGIRRFDAKVAAARATAASTAPVGLHVVNDWDQKTYPPSSDLVVFESDVPIQPESWVKLTLDNKLRSAAGPATPEQPQSYTAHAERAFFIDGFYCDTACDPDRWNPLKMRARVKVTDFAAATTATDVTGAPVTVPKAAQPPKRDFVQDASGAITLEDAGFAVQPPVHKYAVAVRADLRANDGQVLGYPWVGVVDNWHRSAFTSFGDGHGVWEKDGGTTLPFYARNFRDVRQWAVRIEPDQLMPTLRSIQDDHFHNGPVRRGNQPPAADHRRPDSVAWPRSVESSWIQWNRSGLDRCARRRTAPAVTPRQRNYRQAGNARLDCAGHQSGSHGEGQPTEHAGLRDASRQRIAGRRGERLDHQCGQQGVLAWTHRIGRCRTGAANTIT